ncbi:MAG: circularly permuted type 2 ATP-grasp protein [Acidimicrobiia bacterium]
MVQEPTQLDGYVRPGVFDEVYDADGNTRTHYADLMEMFAGLEPEEFAARADARDQAFQDQGITFSFAGEERPFPLDLVPRIIPAEEWSRIEAGVRQRVRVLEAFLDDIYGVGEILHAGVVPRRLIYSSAHFSRAAMGIQPPNGVRIQVAGIDLVRDAFGEYRVLEDNLRVPSGVSYVISNRRAMTHVFPELFTSHRVRRVAEYPTRLFEALRAAAPTHATDPVIAVLTPGIHNAAYFEHTFLARGMGVELVEGRDLVCREDVVYMRTTEGEQRVDVLYRRVDDEFLDPLHFRGDSMLGSPGLLNAARAGNITITNAVGNGIADDKLVYSYLPAMTRFYFDESPILPNVETYRLEDPEMRAYALAHAAELVFKPTDASGGNGVLIGPQASREQLAANQACVEADPRGWIAQDLVMLSTSPTYVDGTLAPRHIDLRPFAINDGRDIWVLPGGLTRVALPEGSLIVNSSQGGGSKDTWVLAEEDEVSFADANRPSRILHTPIMRGVRAPAPPFVQAGQQ